jgi:hypothetical protein
MRSAANREGTSSRPFVSALPVERGPSAPRPRALVVVALAVLASAFTLSLPLAPAARAEGLLQVRTSPSPVALFLNGRARIEVSGLAGWGTVRADVNVGSVERVEEIAGRVVLHYLFPQVAFPQMLCILLKRGDGEVGVVRLPLLGSADIPVKTRASSTVVIRIGDVSSEPISTGKSGRAKVHALVPPGATRAEVEVTDKYGLKTLKKIPIKSTPYNQLALLAIGIPKRPGVPGRIEVYAAASESKDRPVEIQVGTGGMPAMHVAGDAWSATFPLEGEAAGRSLTVRAALPGEPLSVREAPVEIKLQAPLLHTEPEGAAAGVRSSAPTDSRIRLEFGLLVGLLHNLGGFFGPHFGGELGLDFRLPVGRLGVRLVAGYSFASQDIPGPAGLEAARSSVSLIPAGAGLSYRIDFRVLSPYLVVGFLAQTVRTSNTAPYTEERARIDFSPGVFVHLGMDRKLGPGRLLLEAGFLWSRVENPDVHITAGGALVQAGYRFTLAGS